MQLERVGGDLKITEGNVLSVLRIPWSRRPLEELLVRAATGVVVSAKDSDGKARALAILSSGQDSDQLTLAMRVCVEYLRGAEEPNG